MEIAECRESFDRFQFVLPYLTRRTTDLNIPIAMTRGRGTFQKSSYPPLRVDPSDEGAVLEDKWKIWCRRESWKR